MFNRLAQGPLVPLAPNEVSDEVSIQFLKGRNDIGG